MSLGKFAPSYCNAYSRVHHGSNNIEEKDGTSQMHFNGFSSKMSQHHGKGVSHEVEHNGTSETDLEKYIHIEVHPNGGASMVRIYDNEIASLDKEEKDRLAELFFEEVFCEESDNVAKHTIGIVQGAMSYMPELVGYLASTRPDLNVKVSGWGLCFTALSWPGAC